MDELKWSLLALTAIAMPLLLTVITSQKPKAAITTPPLSRFWNGLPVGPELELSTTRVVSAQHFPDGINVPFPIAPEDLMEIHPLGPAHVEHADSEHLHVMVVFENEAIIHHSPAIVPFEWFATLMPLRIFLNLPHDISNVESAPSPLVEPAVVPEGVQNLEKPLLDEILRLADDWSKGRQPKQRTLRALERCESRDFHLEEEAQASIIALCDRKGRLSRNTRKLVAEGLVEIAMIIARSMGFN